MRTYLDCFPGYVTQAEQETRMALEKELGFCDILSPRWALANAVSVLFIGSDAGAIVLKRSGS